ncbi:MAG: hypothetical protein ACRDNK_23945, partial [Solirubrobacteraceae bacterium]
MTSTEPRDDWWDDPSSGIGERLRDRLGASVARIPAGPATITGAVLAIGVRDSWRSAFVTLLASLIVSGSGFRFARHAGGVVCVAVALLAIAGLGVAAGADSGRKRARAQPARSEA